MPWVFHVETPPETPTARVLREREAGIEPDLVVVEGDQVVTIRRNGA